MDGEHGVGRLCSHVLADCRSVGRMYFSSVAGCFFTPSQVCQAVSIRSLC